MQASKKKEDISGGGRLLAVCVRAPRKFRRGTAFMLRTGAGGDVLRPSVCITRVIVAWAGRYVCDAQLGS